LQTRLSSQGWNSRTVDLPTAVRTESDELLPSIFDDARVIREAMDGIMGPVIVVAHSYSGIPVTQATVDVPNLSHIVYLAAYQLDVGESLYSIHGAPQPDPKSLKGVAFPRMNDLASGFYADVAEDQRVKALVRLVHHSHRSWGDQVTQAGWHTVPSSYIICDKDRALSPNIQEIMAYRAGSTYHLDSSHSPFLSIPDELSKLLIKMAK
jgi:hypothetical protein